MARFEFSGTEDLETKLASLERGAIKSIVMAGAEACVADMKGDISAFGHVRTGSMLSNVRPGNYTESMGGGSVDVYPQGGDGRGVSNALKAFVINYGYGGRRTARTGDKFITANQGRTEQDVRAAMQAESDRLTGN